MIHLRESSSIQSSALARLHRAGKTLGAILWNNARTRPGLLLGIAALGVFGVAWAVMKLVFASGGGFVLALLRDAGHQVGGGGLWGALGSFFGGAGGAANGGDNGPTWGGKKEIPPLPPGADHRTFQDDGSYWDWFPQGQGERDHAIGHYPDGYGPSGPLGGPPWFIRDDAPDVTKGGVHGSHEGASTPEAYLDPNCRNAGGCTYPDGSGGYSVSH